MLGREFRITSAQEYNNIYRFGKKIPGRFMVLYYLRNNLGYNRYGFVTSAKVGKAVVRNRIKRQLREMVRQMNPSIKPGYDLVLVVRHHAGSADYQQLEKDLRMVLKKGQM
ncbi:MAG: ribonuclease P protein component [Syntrophomonadaceae bacterium]|mgnify:CR=1 FL=1|jgi:ribonuclease P protein component|nr:ribonuclease P protein component [Bacillota bacterium]NLM88169.1 ribonuclease P protein component [Syntrophomonadaceae bacterium]HAA08306.1 ribonuclease P protein component [Syntrophomonas sp.]HQA50322.1 ribonuclease P protein component [Syntrophomonadaceae bacterium]HQD89541.1 ribonuclease P protein component [Syntrophomonadaceae bacterium]